MQGDKISKFKGRVVEDEVVTCDYFKQREVPGCRDVQFTVAYRVLAPACLSQAIF